MFQIEKKYHIGVRKFGLVNWIGFYTLYVKEVNRFLVVWAQTFVLSVSFVHRMAEHRGAKLQRLNEFRRRLPYAAASAIGAVLQDIAEQGLPELHNRNHVAKAITAAVQTATPYGRVTEFMEPINDDGGGWFSVPVASTAAYMWMAFKEPGG